jgi:predicted AAA+ superfamily ATPase
MFTRAYATRIAARLEEPRRFIQVVLGPRQVGKTTLVRQVATGLGRPWHMVSADEPTLRQREWLSQQWEAGRQLARSAGNGGAVLVVDEIQKVSNWSETVKRLWDEDTASGVPLRVVVLGSAPLAVQQGLTESLAGRFEVSHLPHWSLPEMQTAFGFSLDQYLFFGGYPGAASLITDEQRWARYVKDALVEVTIARDVLLMTRVDRPALLRRLFELGCQHSGQILSYNKMLGQLQDAGNATTLAHYLDLLSASGMVTGFQKYAGNAIRQRGSSPKLQVLNTALMTALSGLTFEEARADRAWWGRLVESAVGAHLANAAAAGDCEVYYWRERSREVDFVVKAARKVIAIEVKSGQRREALPGMDAFVSAFAPDRTLLVGGDGIAIDTFLSAPVLRWAEN